MATTTKQTDSRPLLTPLRALVAGVTIGVTLTAIVSAHDATSDAADEPADAAVLQPTRHVLEPGEQIPDIAPISGPNGEILLDENGRILTFDPSKMTATAVARFNQLSNQAGTEIEAPADGSEAVIVYNEHLPELNAVGAIRALAPGDATLERFCTTEALDTDTCEVMSSDALEAAESAGTARRVDPATFRPTLRP